MSARSSRTTDKMKNVHGSFWNDMHDEYSPTHPLLIRLARGDDWTNRCSKQVQPSETPQATRYLEDAMPYELRLEPVAGPAASQMRQIGMLCGRKPRECSRTKLIGRPCTQNVAVLCDATRTKFGTRRRSVT
jgi:hypothetical protein